MGGRTRLEACLLLIVPFFGAEVAQLS